MTARGDVRDARLPALPPGRRRLSVTGRHRLEAHDVSGCEDRRGMTIGIKDREPAAADDLPPARRLTGINSGLLTRDADRTGWNPQAWRLAPRGRNPVVHRTEIREAGKESQHEDTVVDVRVSLDDLAGAEPGPVGNRGHIRSCLTAVHNGNLDGLPLHHFERRIAHTRQRISQRIGLSLQRIEEDRNRSIGGHHVAHARQRHPLYLRSRGDRPCVDAGIDHLVPFEEQGGVARIPNARRVGIHSRRGGASRGCRQSRRST